MNRIVFIAMAVLSTAPAARAEEESSPAPTADVSALEGRISSIEEQYAETKTAVAALGRIKWSGYVQGRYAYQQCVNNKPSAGWLLPQALRTARTSPALRRTWSGLGWPALL